MIDLLKAHPFFESKTIASCELLENQGYCNENYIVIADGVKYIVRKLLRDDIDRDYEWKVQKLAYEQGITAEPLVYDEVDGFMVFAFLEGKHKEKLDGHDLKGLVSALQNLHNIHKDERPIELHITNKTDEVKKAFKTIVKYPKEYVFCHNDLNSQNIFFSDSVKLIDWEYAGVNDKYFDLACVCVEFKLDEKMQRLFLDTYFSDTYELKKLEAYKVIYIALCKEWFDASV